MLLVYDGLLCLFPHNGFYRGRMIKNLRYAINVRGTTKERLFSAKTVKCLICVINVRGMTKEGLFGAESVRRSVFVFHA